MAKVLVSRPENCTGCEFCEMICSLYHEGLVDLSKARLRVVKRDLETDVPFVCTQCIACGDDCCVEACPEDAISEIDGVVTIDPEACTACGICADTCQYDVIWVADIAYKCDLCGGDPMCVKFCPTEALSYQEAIDDDYSSMIGMLEG